MGKKSREKRERLEATSNMTKEERENFKKQQEEEKKLKKEEQKIIVKNSILMNLKMNWKNNVREQYKKEPDKVINSNIEKNTDDICNNFEVKITMKTQHIEREDIKRILTEIRDEIIQESKGD